jgi:L-lysine exporter family protein LysE/ArgO
MIPSAMIASGVAGFTTAIALIAAIGAQNAFVLRQGLKREHVLAVVLTCALSDALLIGIGIAGLGAFIGDRPTLVFVIRWGGALFLLTYAFLALRRALRPSTLVAANSQPARLGPTILACLAFTYLNPHVYIDTVLLLGSIANQQRHQWLFGLGAALASGVWFTLLGAGASRLAPLLARPTTWRVIDAAVAVLMTGIALTLILA